MSKDAADVAIIISPLPRQMNWAPGTQCVAKCDNRKAKPGELLYHKGDILTIVDTSTVLPHQKSLFKSSQNL